MMLKSVSLAVSAETWRSLGTARILCNLGAEWQSSGITPAWRHTQARKRRQSL